MVDRIYPTELQLDKADSSDTEAPFFDLNLRIANGTVSTKICDIRDDFDLDIVNFRFLDGDVPRHTSYGVYISQLIRFARASLNHSDFNCRNKALTDKLLRQGYCYFKLRKAFSKFHRRHSASLAYSRISHEYSSLFIIVINFYFMFSLWCIDWVDLYANRICMYFCIKSSIGTQGEVS